MADLTDIRTQAEQGVQNVAKLEESIPGLLSGLKANLTSIFSKDNPLIQKREGLLSEYLSIPERTSASLLPANMPVVAGSNLNLSPTQQSAISASRSGAALAPLASLNDLIVGQYGNIGDILGNAQQLYQAQLRAAQTRSAGLFNLYQQAYTEEQDRLAREERAQERQSRGQSGFDINSILSLLGQEKNNDNRPPLDNFIEPDLTDIIQQSFTRPQLPAARPLDLGGRQSPGSAQLRFTL